MRFETFLTVLFCLGIVLVGVGLINHQAFVFVTGLGMIVTTLYQTIKALAKQTN
jgi:hypothetical protein